MVVWLPCSHLRLQDLVFGWRRVDQIRHPSVPAKGEMTVMLLIRLSPYQPGSIWELQIVSKTAGSPPIADSRIIFPIFVVHPSGSDCAMHEYILSTSLCVHPYGATPPQDSQSTCCRTGQCLSMCLALCRLSSVQCVVSCRQEFSIAHTDVLFVVKSVHEW